MPEAPFITIITVVYNAAGLLEKTIQGIQAQTFKDFEYLIIDGGSTDGTVEIIRKYSTVVTTWTSEPDNGLYDAMNKGLKMASGEFVWFINAGDQPYSETIVGSLYEISKKHDADILYGGTVVINESGLEIGLRRQKLPEKLNWKSLKRGMVVSHQSILVKRNIAPLYNLKYKCSADIDWVIAGLKSASHIVNTHLVLSRFLDGGRSKSTIGPSLKERFIIMWHHYGMVTTLWQHIPIAIRFFLFLFRNRRF
jgi:glycosyltransferase involved in cell wall biosynthesis